MGFDIAVGCKKDMSDNYFQLRLEKFKMPYISAFILGFFVVEFEYKI